ncbi:NADH-quinone oxidoreductase subunit J family protein [Phosphitispora fastidiosa]|uniref:NADH-quinone oxidoreductase subunit J family protein n=1 Tax=Phosphitispora fastidiosa TaxID=2837202 RepID=UPI001E2BD202|nr:NADH-quinone oxidoreductase subunit J [Phosphitispora fastidiosa]MBU7005443.1 NADH-quinone oxidoreductase subunit J [Phosphitispora fastidiosa]
MNFMFWLIAIITLGSALMMVMNKNIFHSALFMVVTFLGVAAVYLMLYADFMAAVQVLVYAGAITIFIVFGIMLTQRGNMKETNLFSNHAALAGIVSLALVVINAVMVVSTNWPKTGAEPPQETVGSIAELMLTKYVVPFEVAAILLLVALIGAVIIAKEVKKTS